MIQYGNMENFLKTILGFATILITSTSSFLFPQPNLLNTKTDKIVVEHPQPTFTQVPTRIIVIPTNTPIPSNTPIPIEEIWAKMKEEDQINKIKEFLKNIPKDQVQDYTIDKVGLSSCIGNKMKIIQGDSFVSKSKRDIQVKVSHEFCNSGY